MITKWYPVNYRFTEIKQQWLHKLLFFFSRKSKNTISLLHMVWNVETAFLCFGINVTGSYKTVVYEIIILLAIDLFYYAYFWTYLGNACAQALRVKIYELDFSLYNKLFLCCAFTHFCRPSINFQGVLFEILQCLYRRK